MMKIEDEQTPTRAAFPSATGSLWTRPWRRSALLTSRSITIAAALVIGATGLFAMSGSETDQFAGTARLRERSLMEESSPAGVRKDGPFAAEISIVEEGSESGVARVSCQLRLVLLDGGIDMSDSLLFHLSGSCGNGLLWAHGFDDDIGPVILQLKMSARGTRAKGEMFAFDSTGVRKWKLKLSRVKK